MSEIIFALLITLALGAFIGLQFRKTAEAEGYTKEAFAGMRTSMAITLLGYLSVLLSDYYEPTFIIFSSFFLLLILVSYAYASFIKQRPGGTSEITLASLFLVGALVGYGQTNIAIIVTIILSIIASGRSQLYRVSDKFTQLEIIETLKFAIVIFLILPLLPNEAIDPLGVLNPYNIWLMVILISGIGFIGYMASKFIGNKRGILLSGFIGGSVSSTAVTTTMAIENKKKPKYLSAFGMAILLASVMMYIRVIIEAVIINQAILGRLIIPIGAMLVTMIGFTLYSFYFRKKKEKTPKLRGEMAIDTPFSLKPAIKFSLFFVVILLLIKVSELYLGDKGIYLTAIISSLADVDAITISLSNLSADQAITETLAIRAITYAVIANTLIKIIYIRMFGTKLLTEKMLVVFAVTAVVGIFASFMI